MKKRDIKKAFFNELNSSLPDVPGIKPIEEVKAKEPKGIFKRKPALAVLVPAISLAIVAFIAIPVIAINQNKNQKNVYSEGNGGKGNYSNGSGNKGAEHNSVVGIRDSSTVAPDEVQRQESTDWHVEISTNRGPTSAGRLSVSIYHESVLQQLYNDGYLKHFNGNQQVRLNLIRYCYNNEGLSEETVFTTEDTLNEILLGNKFAKQARFVYEDSFTIEDIPETLGSNGYIKYMALIEGANGSNLEYSFDEGETTVSPFKSLYNGIIGFRTSRSGLSFYQVDNGEY